MKTIDQGTLIAAAAVFGAVIGSFLNVCIYRLPKKYSVIWPGSHCPQCGADILWHDNIPLLSYVWLRGRCRVCNTPISWRYPFVECLNAVGYGLIVWRFGVSATTLAYLLLWSALVVVSFIDLDHMIIP